MGERVSERERQVREALPRIGALILSQGSRVGYTMVRASLVSTE